MNVNDVAVPNGTTHLVSKEDFCRVVNFTEPDDLENRYATYEVEYVIATRNKKDLPVARSFQSMGSEGAGGFVDLLKACPGAKILRGPDKKVLILPSQEDFILPRLVGYDGAIIDQIMESL